MSNIDRSGVFRGEILSRGVATSSGGYPQLLLSLRATEKYEEAEGVWQPWDFEEVEAQAYLILFGKDNKPTKNVHQAMKALKWDGMSFAKLQEDETVTQIQWRMESHTYNEQERIQVAWIDAYDADPTRKVQKLEAADIKALDAKYAAALKNLGGGPKPKSAKPAAPPQAPADPTPAAAMPTTTPASAAASPTAEIPKKKKKHERPATPKAPATPAATMDQGTAWETLFNKGNIASKTDVEITNAWIAAVNEAGGDEAVGTDWSGIYTKAAAALGV